jgi:pentatricopeptide repeat protein
MNVIIYTTLIKAYTKARDMNKAFDVYNTMLNDQKAKVNIVAHNAMLDCCVECKDFTKMNEIYENIKAKVTNDESQPGPDLITYSTVIKGYAREGNMSKVFDCYNFLKKSQFKLDEVVYNSILDGCAKDRENKSFDRAIEIYNDMKNLAINRSNVTYSILIKLFSSNRKEEQALQLLDEMKSNGIKPGVIVYTCLIQTCFRTKRFDQSIKLFEEMKNSGIKPDHVLYNTVVNGCLHHQNWELACSYTIESFNFNVKLAEDIYNNVLDKICSHYCNMRNNLKCDFAMKIIKELKNKGIQINYELYSKVAKLVYKIQGVKISLNGSPSKEEEQSNGFNRGENKQDSNKDQMKYQRKIYNNFK